jgi:hypothetical protein
MPSEPQYSYAGGGSSQNVAAWPRTVGGYAGLNPATNGRIFSIPPDTSNIIYDLEKPQIDATITSNGTIIVGIYNFEPGARYQAFVNGRLQGYYNPGEDYIGKYIELGNFIIGKEYNVYVVATAVTYYTSGPNNGSWSEFISSPNSDVITFTPTWDKLPRSAINMNVNSYDFVNITRVSSSLYASSSFLASSTYKEIFDPTTVYNPIPFDIALSVSFFRATVKLRVRRSISATDGTFLGSVDFVFKDAEVTLDDPFAGALYTVDQTRVDAAYNAKRTALGYNNRDMSGDLVNAIEYKLKREYTLAKPFLIKKIEQTIKNDFSVAFKSRDANSQFRDLINWDPRLTADFQDFEIIYDGGIFMNCKIISTSSTEVNVANKPLYSLKSSKNRILKTGSSVTSILLSNPQECAHFGFSVMTALTNDADFNGTAPA